MNAYGMLPVVIINAYGMLPVVIVKTLALEEVNISMQEYEMNGYDYQKSGLLNFFMTEAVII